MRPHLHPGAGPLPYGVSVVASSQERPAIVTFDGLKVVEVPPGYLDRPSKANCPFTYYRPLSGKGNNYCPGAQFWAHPPDLTANRTPVSETSSAFARKARPQSAHTTNGCRRSGTDSGSGYAENNRADSGTRMAQTDPGNWRTTYGDLQSTGYMMPRLLAGGLPRARPGTARRSITESGAPEKPMGKAYHGTPRRTRPSSAHNFSRRAAI